MTIKRVLIVLALLAAFAFGQNFGPRMQFEGSEKVYDATGKLTFDYFHDRETKQEVVCAFGGINTTSCYLTGRTW